MIDIVIKSYNRAYLLDRAIWSIYKYVKQGLGNIVILDDGTPKKLLDKILDKYPNVIIKKSPMYDLKLQHGSNIPPIQFWKEEIQSLSENFLVFEDDLWFVDEINLDEISSIIVENSISILKLCWWGNNKKNKGEKISIGNNYEVLKPNVSRLAERLVKNQYYLHSFISLFNLRPKDYFLRLYTYYDVAGHVFNKKFYNYVWPSSQTNVQEMIQLGKAAEWFRLHSNCNIGLSKNEKIITSFTSSSSGQKEKLGFDMYSLNAMLNNAWLLGDFDSLHCFPNDFTFNYLQPFLSDWNHADLNAWMQWSIKFRQDFINMGSDIHLYNNLNELN